MKKTVIGVLLAAGVCAVAVGQTIAAKSQHDATHSHTIIVAGNDGKVAICHVPPGNPANRHTIHVGQAAVNAHLAHGDSIGACGGGGIFIPPNLPG